MAHSTKKLGMMFTTMGWVLGFLLLALLFSSVLDRQNNPNRQLKSLSSGEAQELVLQRNRAGHYIFTGKVNGRDVDFLVDTGATTTSVPGALASEIGLQNGAPISVQTAAGTTRAFLTRLETLQMGDILFSNIPATIIPEMNSAEVLLGMNVLKHMELVQRDNQLIIRHLNQ